MFVNRYFVHLTTIISCTYKFARTSVLTGSAKLDAYSFENIFSSTN